MKELIVFSAEDQSCICVMRQFSDCLMDLEITPLASPRRNVFVTYHNEDFSAVKMGNKDISQIASIGDVYLEIEMGWLLCLKMSGISQIFV